MGECKSEKRGMNMVELRRTLILREKRRPESKRKISSSRLGRKPGDRALTEVKGMGNKKINVFWLFL